MQSENRCLVVGTTSDYIDWIRRACPQRAIFITDPDIRSHAREPAPMPHEEILCDLSDKKNVREKVSYHLGHWGIGVNGVACFDCESMSLAALLANDFSSPYPSLTAVNNCRDKLISKTLWQKNGIRCPGTAPVRNVEDVIDFLSTHGQNCVLKPISGSGSELVFRCDTEKECQLAFGVIEDGLKQRKHHRLYRGVGDSPQIIVEEFVDGHEYSCDFLMDDNEATLIRLAQKIPSFFGPFGMTMGYVLIDTLPKGIDVQTFCRYMAKGAAALGIDRSICMADFLIRGGEIILLEMAPRPGGDCLPALIRSALKVDIIALTLDVAQKRSFRIGPFQPTRPFVGLRIHARQSGIFKRINCSSLKEDPKIKEIRIVRHPGDIIKMPPEDYDSSLLGHIIFSSENGMNFMKECGRLLDSLTIEIESP